MSDFNVVHQDTAETTQVIIDAEDDLFEQLKSIDILVKDVASGNEEHFWTVKGKGSTLFFRRSRLGSRLIDALCVGEAVFSFHFPGHALSPYVELLFICAKRVDNPLLFSYIHALSPDEVEQAVSMMNDLVADIRREARSDRFLKHIRKFVRAANKRTESLNRYIDALFDKYSRLVVVRVDMAYKASTFVGLNMMECLGQVKKDWATMRKALHKGVPISHVVGFACTLEYGHLKGFHYHLLLFFDGAHHREDIVLGRLIGEYWVENVTNGRGSYYNCNMYKYRYKKLGIGILNYYDVGLIGNLKSQVSSYIVKVDYWVRLIPEYGRSFFRGNMPRIEKVKRGRPRKLVRNYCYTRP